MCPAFRVPAEMLTSFGCSSCVLTHTTCHSSILWWLYMYISAFVNWQSLDLHFSSRGQYLYRTDFDESKSFLRIRQPPRCSAHSSFQALTEPKNIQYWVIFWVRWIQPTPTNSVSSNIHFNVVTSTSKASSLFLAISVIDWNSVCILMSSHAYYMPHSSYLLQFVYAHMWCRIVYKLCSFSPCTFL